MAGAAQKLNLGVLAFSSESGYKFGWKECTCQDLLGLNLYRGLYTKTSGSQDRGLQVQTCAPEVRGPRPSSDRHRAGFSRPARREPHDMLMASNRRLWAAAALTTIFTSKIFALAGAQMSGK